MMMWWIGLGAASFAVETGDGDTGGGSPTEDTASTDTGALATSAAALAGEVGGCRCSSLGGPHPGLLVLTGLVGIVRRRERA